MLLVIKRLASYSPIQPDRRYHAREPYLKSMCRQGMFIRRSSQCTFSKALSCHVNDRHNRNVNSLLRYRLSCSSAFMLFVPKSDVGVSKTPCIKARTCEVNNRNASPYMTGHVRYILLCCNMLRSQPTGPLASAELAKWLRDILHKIVSAHSAPRLQNPWSAASQNPSH